MLKCRRHNYRLGGSKAMTYPGDAVVGPEATMAGNRLLIVDPRGEIDENDLAEFVENHVEPAFKRWRTRKAAEKQSAGQGLLTPMQGEGPVAEAVEQAEIQHVEAGPPVYLVTCWRCGGQIAWRTDLGTQGGCPYCHAWLQLAPRG